MKLGLPADDVPSPVTRATSRTQHLTALNSNSFLLSVPFGPFDCYQLSIIMRAAALISIAALASPAVSTGGYPTEKPLVSSKELQKHITIKNLLAGSQKLQDFADANGGNRAFGGGGHLATTDWLYSTLKKTDYYEVVKQPFVELFTAATVVFKAGGTEYAGQYMTYGPKGDLKGVDLVKVNNLGCAVADFPPEVTGKIALISRGTCPFGKKLIFRCLILYLANKPVI